MATGAGDHVLALENPSIGEQMTFDEAGPVSVDRLLDYFLEAAKPRARWRVGMEIERIGRNAGSGHAIPYDGETASVRRVLEFYRTRRGGDPIWEADHLVGLDHTDWGSITLEPGGQVEWSSRPSPSLDGLYREMTDHAAVLNEAGDELGVNWLPQAVDPDLPVSAMCWMPKARYNIMAPFLAARGQLAHRMMTQTASIQAAFDYADAEDWRRKFLAASLLAPVATALFANSSRVDGRESGYQSYRQTIWEATDPERCRLPYIVFEPEFDLEQWLDWILEVPTIFRHRARGLVPAGGPPFRELLELSGCDAIRWQDWETHVSTIFTEVRSYTYIEVRSADLQPDDLAFSVPAFWTGILYDDQALDAALDLGAGWARHVDWVAAMQVAARDGLTDRGMRDLATKALAIAAGGLKSGAACVEDRAAAVRHLERLATARDLNLKL